jgi:ubiquinone/menaquinone biosynthesis C-methylase UbiE
MQRIPEPDLMNNAEQALAYAQADFSEPHNQFVALFQDSLQGQVLTGNVLDLGCGPADICIRMAKAFPDIEIIGVDGAPAMLALGREAMAGENLNGRISLIDTYLPAISLPDHQYRAITSNSLLHHLTDPLDLWRTIQSVAQNGARIFVMDLMRPVSTDQARQFVDVYAEGEPEILRHDFYHSLLAAYRPDEVAAQLRLLSITCLQIDVVSDRHFTVSGVWETG